MIAMRIECRDECGRREKVVVVVVVYMTVMGIRADRENRKKYDLLKKVVREHRDKRVLVMGDMNAHIGILGERMNRNGKMLEELVIEMGLENLNVTLAEGRVTWNAREHESAIDYMLVNGRMREIVLRMWIDEDDMVSIVSDHNMMVVECLIQGRSEGSVVGKEKKCRLRDIGWENFRVDLSERRGDDGVSVYDVEHLNEGLFGNVRSAAEEQIEYVRVSRRWNQRGM